MSRLPSESRVTALSHPAPDAWDATLVQSKQPHRFSHRAMAGAVFESAYDSYTYRPCDVTYADGTRALVPLIRSDRRLPQLTTYYGMPLSLEGTPVVLDGVLDEPKLCSLFMALGGRGRMIISGGITGSPPPAGDVVTFETHVLQLATGFESLWENSFSGKNRNSCRKAEKSGIEVSRVHGDAAFGTYYDLYAEATRQWGYAAPPYPRSLFTALSASGGAELWLARLHDRVVAGAMFLQGSHDLFYWSGATHPDAVSLAPSNALLRAAIESACERGFSMLDFGASPGLPGVQKFKESFGAESVRYGMADVKSRSYRSTEWLRRRLLPVAAT